MTKLKALADNKLNGAKIGISLFDRVENTVGKGENVFSPFPTMFSKGFFVGVVKSGGLCGKKLKFHLTLDFESPTQFKSGILEPDHQAAKDQQLSSMVNVSVC